MVKPAKYPSDFSFSFFGSLALLVDPGIGEQCVSLASSRFSLIYVSPREVVKRFPSHPGDWRPPGEAKTNEKA